MDLSRAQPLLFVVGDSISIQYGPYLERDLRGRFVYDRKGGVAEALKNLDIPEGANGGDSRMVLEYLRPLLAEESFRPRLLLINCGLHDIKVSVETGKLQVSLGDYRQNLGAIATAVAQKGIAMAWVRTTHSVDMIHNSRSTSFHRFAADNEAYDAVALEVMAAHRVPVLDLRSFTRNLGGDDALFCDHVHFSEPVRERQGAFIAGWLDAWAALGNGQ